MKATLKAEAELWEIIVMAELAIWEVRPELQRLCAAIAAIGGPSHLAFERQLPGLSRRGLANIVRHLEYLRLIDGDSRLTKFGRHCAKSGEAPSWEQGVYRLLVAKHQIFQSLILDFQRAARDPSDRDYTNLIELPSWLKPNLERVYDSAVDQQTRFSVASFPSPKDIGARCRMNQCKPAQVTWEINLSTGQNSWRIEGRLWENRHVFQSSPGSVDASKLVNIYSQWEPRWNESAGWLAMKFDGRVLAGGREEFRRSRRYPKIQLPPFGAFTDVDVDNIPVGPASDGDARDWATAITVGRVEAAGGYCIPSAWRRQWNEATTANPLEGRAGIAPEPTTVRAIAGKPLHKRTCWLLATAEDLGVEA